MAVDKVDSNATAITEQVQRFFHTASLHSRWAKERDPTSLSAPKVLNNLTWHASLTLLSFLRFPGKLLRVNALLTRDSVKSRLGSSQGRSEYHTYCQCILNQHLKVSLLPNSAISYSRPTTSGCYIKNMAWNSKWAGVTSGEILSVAWNSFDETLPPFLPTPSPTHPHHLLLLPTRRLPTIRQTLKWKTQSMASPSHFFSPPQARNLGKAQGMRYGLTPR